MKPVRLLAILPALVFLTIASIASAQTTRFARVTADGVILARSNVASVGIPNGLRYEVIFSQSIATCAIIATTIGNGGAAHLAQVGRHATNTNLAFVAIRSPTGTIVKKPFTIAAFCGQPHTYFAAVHDSGQVSHASPGTTVSRISTGRFAMRFTANIASCTYLAQMARSDGAPPINGHGVYVGSATGGGVLVETRDLNGNLRDGVPFHLAVVCGSAAGVSSGVVQLTGPLLRGSPGTGSFRSAVGRYEFVSNKMLARCGVVATRGSVNALSPSPATVETSASPYPNVARISVRQLQASGGALADQSFHAVALCP